MRRVPETLSPTVCLPLVSQLVSHCVYFVPPVSSTLPPTLSSNLSPTMLPTVSHFVSCSVSLVTHRVSHLSHFVLHLVSRRVSHCLHCVSHFVIRLVSHRVSHCLPLVSQMSRCGLSTCFPASQMWSSNCLSIVSLSLEFETTFAIGLQSWVKLQLFLSLI